MPRQFNFDPNTYLGLDKLGRIPLSRHFHLREFLYSEIASHYGMRNVPDDVDRAVASGSALCSLLLDPLQDAFGRVHVRSGYRSRAVNLKGVGKHNCAADNGGAHTWDADSASGHGAGAMACVSIPSLSRRIAIGEFEVAALAWWIVDHLPDYSTLEFFAPPANIAFADEVVFNIGWHERPLKRITSRRAGARWHENMPDPDARKKMWSPLTSAC